VPDRPDPAGELRARQVASERAFAPLGPTVWAQIAAYCESSPRRAEPLLAWYALTQLQIAAEGGAAASGAGEVRPCRSAELQGRHRTTEWRRRRWAEEAGIARCGPPAPPARRWGPNARIRVELLYARGQEVVALVRERARRPGKAERTPRQRPGPPARQRPPAEPGELARRAQAALERDIRAARERSASPVGPLAPRIAALVARVQAQAGAPERAHAPPGEGGAATDG
jgi:hypothetical protein